MDTPPFEAMESIARLTRNCVISEKIDGTNAQVCVLEDGRVLAGSRTRWITPDDDNMGFARWVVEHEEELRVGLGVGRHFGEWWGAGIQRRYGLTEKRFSLFNAGRWSDDPGVVVYVAAARKLFKKTLGGDGRWSDDPAKRAPQDPRLPTPGERPACCHVVPVLFEGVFTSDAVDATLTKLGTEGSAAAPGFMNPEGVVVYVAAARKLFKKTLGGDGHKGAK